MYFLTKEKSDVYSNMQQLFFQQQPLPIIFFLIGFLVLMITWKIRKTRHTPTRRMSMIAMMGSIVLTLFSLYVSRTAPSGTGIRTQYGWPHVVYEHWQSIEGVTQYRHVVFGPFALYILANIGFYFVMIMCCHLWLKPKK